MEKNKGKTNKDQYEDERTNVSEWILGKMDSYKEYVLY